MDFLKTNDLQLGCQGIIYPCGSWVRNVTMMGQILANCRAPVTTVMGKFRIVPRRGSRPTSTPEVSVPLPTHSLTPSLSLLPWLPPALSLRTLFLATSMHLYSHTPLSPVSVAIFWWLLMYLLPILFLKIFKVAVQTGMWYNWIKNKITIKIFFKVASVTQQLNWYFYWIFINLTFFFFYWDLRQFILWVLIKKTLWVGSLEVMLGVRGLFVVSLNAETKELQTWF